jgi:1-acyl-sn-glycerol-3-phosphate acyltransferase
MLLAATLPGRFVFTPTRGFTRNFASRVFMARLGSLFVGGRGGDAERIASLVQGGRSVVVFPEGGVYPGAGLRPFRTGAFVAAVEAQVPVSPVAIRGSRRLFDHHQWLPRWSPIAVQVLPPLHPDGTGPDAVERLREAARGAIAGHVDEPLVEA